MRELERLHALFDELLEVPTGRRDAWLAQRGVDAATRAELDRLAAADDAQAGMLDRTLGGYVLAPERAAPAERSSDPIGRRIGPFRLRQRLGQGGMAAVFLAERENADFTQSVALKLLRRDDFSPLDLALFRRERQVLAKLAHPNIARLIDGGVSEDGVPYLAMEYIAGVPLTQWCRERDLNLRERVALVAKVARAVAAAHAALIVHRDIKPSNVLVGEDGEPKLLDFGIAKALHDDGETTRGGLAPMTPEYAAPEQFAGGPITTATDVYALGVLLYELLTGVRPARRAPKLPSAQLAAARSVGSSSTTTRRVRGDLDKVVLMALAEEPERRYPSAAAFADDLERHLAHQPVIAHPPSVWYRTRKFVQRHRGGATITALLVLGIVVSLALALWQASVARQEAARANSVRDFVVDLLRRTAPSLPQAERPDIPTLVYTAAASLPDGLRDQPQVRIELLYTLGNVLRHMQDLPRSEALLRQAVDAAQVLPSDATLRLVAQVELARTLLKKGDTASARAQLAPVLALPAARLPDELPRAMLLKIEMAIAATRGERERASALAEEVIAGYRADCAAGLRCAERAYAEHDAGAVLIGLLQIERARESLEAALTHKRALPAPPGSVALTLTELSFIAYVQGDLARAEARVREAESLLQALGDGLRRPPLEQRQQLAEILLAQGKASAALPLLEEVHADYVARHASACALAYSHSVLAQAQLLTQRTDAALASSAAARTTAAGCPQDERLLNRAHATLLQGQALFATGRRDEAVVVLDEALRDADLYAQLGPGRQLLVRAAAMRLAQGLGRDVAAREQAEALLALLDRLGAVPAAPLRREAQRISSRP